MHLWTDCSGPDRTVVLAICCAQLYVRQNCDTWTANWALSMLVSLSQSLTQWEGTQHANSALVNSCLCVSGKILGFPIY